MYPHIFKPCPFCGSNNINMVDFGIATGSDAGKCYYSIKCECGAYISGVSKEGGYLSREEATAAWNNRSEPSKAIPETIKNVKEAIDTIEVQLYKIAQYTLT